MIEWQDSAQPIPSWSFLSSFEASGIITCASVGWMIRDDDDMKALAPNMGALQDESSVQISGVIQIPTRCIVSVTRLKEPCFCAAVGVTEPESTRDTKVAADGPVCRDGGGGDLDI